MSTEQLLPVLWRRRWSFLLAFAVVLGTVAAVTRELPKVYSATSYLLVAPGRAASTDFETTQVSGTLTKTYGELLQTERTAQEVQAVLGSAVADGDVGGQVDIEFGDNQLIKIKARGASAREAQLIANTYAGVFASGSERFSNAIATPAIVKVAQSAVLPQQPSRPRPKLYLLIGAFLATLAGAALALLRQRLDQRLDLSAGDVEVLGLPIIGRIPDIARPLEWASGRSGLTRSSKTSTDAFRLLLANLAFVSLGERPKTIAVVSASAAEGKSTTALWLSHVSVETGASTLVVEGDMRQPNLRKKLGQDLDEPKEGLSQFLAHAPVVLSDAVVRLPDGLHVLSAGPVPPNPTALLAGDGLADFDARARSLFDLVVYDSPPVSIGADASLLAARADGVIFVVDARRTKRDAASRAIDQLGRARANLLGVVLNRVSEDIADPYYYGAGPAQAGTSAPDAPVALPSA